MPKLLITDRGATLHELIAPAGVSLMEGIRDAGIDELLALCGGCCSCGTCHVHIDDAWIDVTGRASQDESDLLDGSDHRTDRSRLACQIQLSAELDGLRATIAPED